MDSRERSMTGSRDPEDREVFFDPGSVMGFVLAGGRSRRMGVDKASILVDGRTALERQWELVGQFCAGTVAIIGSSQIHWKPSRTGHAAAMTEPVVLDDCQGGQGPLDGLLTALQYALPPDPGTTTNTTSASQHKPAFALVIAVDLWNVTPLEIGRLFAVMADPVLGPMTDVAYLHSGGGSGDQPLCALWRVSESLEALMPAFIAGERSVVRAWMDLRRTAVAVAESVLANINTPEDVEDWKALHRAEPDKLIP